MTGNDGLSAMAGQLETLRACGDHRAWDALRRLTVVAECCTRSPLLEVMGTDPPCVCLGQATVSERAATTFAGDGPRARWQGVGRARGGQGLVWLSTFEQMAGTNLRQWVWCRHRRWYVSETAAPKAVTGGAIWIPLGVVLTKKGRHVATVADTPGRMR